MRTKAALLALVLAGCGGEGDHSAPQSTALIGFQGGFVTVLPQVSTSAGVVNASVVGATATIPPGALAQTVLVSIVPTTLPAVGGFTAVGPAFALGPTGTAIVSSNTITITAPATPPATADMANVVVLLETPAGFTVLTPTSSTATAVDVASGAFGTFEAVLVTPLDPAGSTVTGPAGTVRADGVSMATISVVVLDTNGVRVPGAAVTFTSTQPTDVIVQPAPTNANGQTTGTLASASAETTTVTVSVVPLSGGPAVTLATTASVVFK